MFNANFALLPDVSWDTVEKTKSKGIRHVAGRDAVLPAPGDGDVLGGRPTGSPGSGLSTELKLSIVSPCYLWQLPELIL